MPFSQSMPVVSPPAKVRQEPVSAVVLPIALGLLIALPWLANGYIFGTDWPGRRMYVVPSEVSSSAPLQLLLAAIARLVGGEATGKILVFAILIAGGILAYLGIPSQSQVARAAGAVIFVANPFVFGRLHYGQLPLL